MISKHPDYYQIDNITLIPSVHNSLDFANVVRKIFLSLKPDCVAVEIPYQFTGMFLKGIRRLPYLSMIAFPTEKNEISTIPIVPGDSIIEAARLSDEYGCDLHCVDIDLKSIQIKAAIMPDTYYVHKLNLQSYVEKFVENLPPVSLESQDYIRELFMAFNVRLLAKSFKRVLFVYGIYHHPHLMHLLGGSQQIEKPKLNPAERDYVKLIHYPGGEFLGMIPYFQYLYEIQRKGRNSYHIGLDLPPTDTNYNIEESYNDAFLDLAYEKAQILKSLSSVEDSFDSYAGLQELITKSRTLYKREWQDNAPMGKLSLALKFARNYALVDNQLVPSAYQLIIAGKSVINDDYAWELFRLLGFYPFIENFDQIEEWDFDEENHTIMVNGKIKKYIPYYPRPKMSRKSIPITPRQKENHPGEWRKVWSFGLSLVSYPPEDIIIENYFQYLRHKMKKHLEEKSQRTVEFKSSLLDGLDIKETIRNLHLEKIYVKENIPVSGDVGTIVLIFDENDGYERYPFEMTWLAEHTNESDLALYSTAPDEKLVGPGIGRAQYGGLLSVFPPRNIYDVWTDPRFNKAESRKERLMLAAIFYANKRFILYVAHSPPKMKYVAFAERMGHRIIFFPLQTLSQDKIKKIRYFHLLRDKSIRRIASRYIRFDK